MNIINVSNNTDYRFLYKKVFWQILQLLQERLKIFQELILDITLSTPEEVRKLNQEFRHHNQTTDVLSFPSDHLMYNTLPFLHLGEIIFNVEKTRSQAKEYNHSLKREFCYLFAHSVLHLLGYDHLTEATEKEMHEIVSDVLNEMKIFRF